MDLPEVLLEEVFSYLSWSDRIRAARVCHKWLSVFHAPSLWRRIVFKPPTRSMTRLQYDMKGYYMSCCLRTIGWYVREYRFAESEDIFLLNRTLSLVAKFLEANPPRNKAEQSPPRQRHRSLCLDGALIEPDHDDDDDVSESSSESTAESATSDEHTLPEPLDFDDLEDDGEVVDSVSTGQQQLSSYLSLVTGDPDAEATLKLILKLQEREMLGENSSSSGSSNEEEEEEDFLSLIQSRSAATSVSVPRAVLPTQPATRRGHPVQRSHSCRYPRYYHVRRDPPTVHSFILDFHCEVDDLRWFVYGTGGALLTTIRRLLQQLVHVQRLRLTDLFLTITDARNLVLDIAKASSSTLQNLNLVHLYKPWTDHNALAPVTTRLLSSSDSIHGPRDASGLTPGGGGGAGLDEDWYLLDSRWLQARPRRLQHNPLADLASLFPALTKLSLTVTQITGPMLLRLLYQTNLCELCLVQTDFTPFSLSPVLESDADLMPPEAHAAPVARHASLDDDSAESAVWHPRDEPDDDLIEWGEDVPHYRDHHHATSNSLPWVVSPSSWEPIRVAVWTAALVLRPRLSVQLKCLFTRTGFDNMARLDQLLALWPQPPVPVSTVVFRTTHGVRWSAACLSFRNPVNLASYSATLTTLILWIDDDSEQDHRTDAKSNNNNNKLSSEVQELNDHLREALTVCPLLSLVALGGSFPYLSLITLLLVCRLRGRRQSLIDATNTGLPRPFELFVERDCCLLWLNDTGQRHALPSTVQAWYSTVLEEPGSNLARRALAAERCISQALGQPRWHFLSPGEFESHVARYFD